MQIMTFTSSMSKDAGTRMVKITDNGIGMDRDDATLAFSRHATSKCHDLF